MDSFLIKIKTPFYDPFSPIEWHFSPSSKQTPSNFNLIKIEFMTSPILYDWILSPWYGDLQIQKNKEKLFVFQYLYKRMDYWVFQEMRKNLPNNAVFSLLICSLQKQKLVILDSPRRRMI